MAAQAANKNAKRRYEFALQKRERKHRQKLNTYAAAKVQYSKALQNIHKKLKHNGKVLVTDLWTKEAFIIFLQKCKENGLKILSIDDQTENTIKSMEEDISKTFLKFKDKINNDSITAFIDIQKERLEAFKKNINRHYKFVIQ